MTVQLILIDMNNLNHLSFSNIEVFGLRWVRVRGLAGGRFMFRVRPGKGPFPRGRHSNYYSRFFDSDLHWLEHVAVWQHLRAGAAQGPRSEALERVQLPP